MEGGALALGALGAQVPLRQQECAQHRLHRLLQTILNDDFRARSSIDEGGTASMTLMFQHRLHAS